MASGSVRVRRRRLGCLSNNSEHSNGLTCADSLTKSLIPLVLKRLLKERKKATTATLFFVAVKKNDSPRPFTRPVSYRYLFVVFPRLKPMHACRLNAHLHFRLEQQELRRTRNGFCFASVVYCEENPSDANRRKKNKLQTMKNRLVLLQIGV